MEAHLNKFMSRKEDGCIFLGHASALVRLSDKLILCDPMWGNYKPYAPYWAVWPSQINCDSILDKIDLCIVSHIHQDHWVPEILARLKCPVAIMAGRPALKEKLSHFAEVIEILPHPLSYCWGPFSTAFFMHEFNSVDSSVVLYNDSTIVYHGNDSFLGPKRLEEVKETFPHIDIAMLPTKFIHYYPFLCKSLNDGEREKETWRLVGQSINQANNFLREIDVRHWFPVGASIYYAEGGKDHILNSHLFYDRPFAKRHLDLTAGDTIYKYGRNTMEINVHAPSDEPFPKKDFPAVTACGFIPDITKLREKISKAAHRVPGLMISVNDLHIDAGELTVQTAEAITESEIKQKIHFKVDAPIYLQWIKGEMTFEEVLGTRRFQYWRSPNKYNLEAIEWFSREM